MKTYRNFFIVLFLIGITFFAPDVKAEQNTNTIEPYKQCSELVKECFAIDTQERANCFFSSATHPFCEGSALGKLTYKRWIMAPNKQGDLSAPPSFLGPQVIDGVCLRNFDSEWSGILINESFNAKKLSELEKTLDACKKDISNELMRP